MFAEPNPADAQGIIGELLSGYAVCPAGCEIMEIFRERTVKEVAGLPKCTLCGHDLDAIMLHVVTV